ncbi:alpha-(1-_3)-arabinofuranosyltransferase [Micromonospora gifhornensis]|uniref:Coagulation factor 5/8 type n=1 Tax=Micromonospora gifhornensis TaxID=84594 RepID=A0ABQ4IL56_9ACTN|nr:alpha-(1->3)-arabinofuranosyltransferase [Micromonospora gifhornensis]GIJ18639.1 coagulation factor 5/8 type [Micromonospora gifhornensis]
MSRPLASPLSRASARVRRSPGTVLSLLLLTAIAFAQRPGQVTFDTKLDLAANPIHFMARALHLWNPEATAGELQNQAYGYLFPMGPFFAAGQLLDIPQWITQRLWTALLLAAAFYGLLRLARAMDIGTEPTRYAAALGYALAPRILTEVGALSSETLSAAMLPWVLLPLVTVRRIGSPRRAAALSALAVLGMGGINAAVVLMALVLPGVWLLTRRWDAEHRRLVAWWCVCVVGVCLWWIVPLLLLGQYSLPFLDYIESSTTTTAVASLFQAVRGTNQWVAYIVQGEPWWPAGWLLIDHPVLMALTAVVALIGLAGLAGNLLPQRRFLVAGFLAGLTLLTIGYVGAVDSPVSELVRGLLDGPLAPLRNVHKLDPVLRLPLMLGFAHGVDAVATRMHHALARRRPGVRLRPLVFVPVLMLVLGAAAPAWLGLLRPGPGWADLPPHWRSAATWLADRDALARTLMVPGSGFGQYEWGRTVDEPLQALAGAPWAVRHQIPLGSAGNTRMMDTVEEVLASGRGSTGLADLLARSGFRHLLLRNDIDRIQVDAPPVAVLRRALAESPGITRVATFGSTDALTRTIGSPVDEGFDTLPAIEVYQVDAPVPAASAVLTADVPTVSGGPESLLALLEQGVVERDRPVVLAGDRDETPEATGDSWIVTDGLRRRERDIGRVRDNLSQTLTANESGRQGRVALDLLPFSGEQHQTTATYQGVREVSASSAVSFVDTLGPADPSRLPFAAVDGDPHTAWHSAPLSGPVGQWLEVDLDTPRQVENVRLSFVTDLAVGWPVTRFRLTTDRGSVDHEVAPTLGGHTYYTLPGPTSRVRVTVLAVADGRLDGAVGIRELTIADTEPRRALRAPTDLPQDPAGPVSWVFSRGPADRPACHLAQASEADRIVPVGSPVRAADTVIRCDRFLARVGEEPLGLDRIFRNPAAGTYRMALRAVARPGGDLKLSGLKVTASASSRLAGDPAVTAYAAIDGDPGTAWLADTGDLRPTLRLSWSGSRRIDQLRLRAAQLPVGSLPDEVEIRTPGREVVVPVGADGTVRFPAVRTNRIEIVVRSTELRIADQRGNGWPATAGIAEVEIPALAKLLKPVDADTRVIERCGDGPTVELDGHRYDTSVDARLGDVLAGRPVPLRVCGPGGAVLDLPAGGHRLGTSPSKGFLVQDASLRPVADAASGAADGATAPGVDDATSPGTDGAVDGVDKPRHRAVTVLDWAPTDRTVRVAGGESALLVVPENANPGWTATLGGTPLTPTRVDGWQQAWVLPAGAGGEVRLIFAPDRAYRGALLAGALTVVGVLLLAAWPARRRSALGPEPGASGAASLGLERGSSVGAEHAAAVDGGRAAAIPAEAPAWLIGGLLVVLLAALGGVLPVAIVLAAMVLRQLAVRALPVVVLGGLTVATVIAVTGRVQGHGQSWAYGSWVQAAMLVAVGAVVAAVMPTPGVRNEPPVAHDVTPGTSGQPPQAADDGTEDGTVTR